jgi:hypothetical protein
MITINTSDNKIIQLQENEPRNKLLSIIVLCIGIFILLNKFISPILFGIILIFSIILYFINYTFEINILDKSIISYWRLYNFKIGNKLYSLDDYSEILVNEMYHELPFRIYWNIVYDLILIGKTKQLFLGKLKNSEEELNNLKALSMRLGYDFRLKQLNNTK